MMACAAFVVVDTEYGANLAASSGRVRVTATSATVCLSVLRTVSRGFRWLRYKKANGLESCGLQIDLVFYQQLLIDSESCAAWRM
jgi:hypothetical protein